MVVGRPEILFGPGGIKRDQVRLLEEAKMARGAKLPCLFPFLPGSQKSF